MQKLKLAEDIFDMIGVNKHSTLRLKRRYIELGDLIFESTDELRTVKVQVTMVMYSTFEDLPEDIYIDEGFKSMEELYLTMKRFYPEMTKESECTAVFFS